MPRYWECPNCRALLTRERLEAAGGVCPYCDARVGPPSEFADPDAPPLDFDEPRGPAPIVVPATVGGKLAIAARLLVERLPLVAALVFLFKLPANAGIEVLIERRGAAAHPLAPLMLKFVVEIFFDPIVTAAVLIVLAQRMSGVAMPFRAALRGGLDFWWWLLAARVIKQLTILVVGFGAFIPEFGPFRILFLIPMLFLVIRYALVDEVVVLDHAPILDSRRQSSDVVLGRVWQVIGGGFGSLVLLLFLAQLVGRWAEGVDLLDDPMARGLLITVFDVLAVYNTIVLFLIFWEASREPGEKIDAKPDFEEEFL